MSEEKGACLGADTPRSRSARARARASAWSWAQGVTHRRSIAGGRAQQQMCSVRSRWFARTGVRARGIAYACARYSMAR
eukprot:4348768-Pleurochrysis_carterae.AAC.1